MGDKAGTASGVRRGRSCCRGVCSRMEKAAFAGRWSPTVDVRCYRAVRHETTAGDIELLTMIVITPLVVYLFVIAS